MAGFSRKTSDELLFMGRQDGVIYVLKQPPLDQNTSFNVNRDYQSRGNSQSAGVQNPTDHCYKCPKTQRHHNYNPATADRDVDHTWSGAGAPVTSPTPEEPRSQPEDPQLRHQSGVNGINFRRGIHDPYDYSRSAGGFPVTSPSSQ